MTLIEVLIVISIMAVIYAVAMPQINLRTGFEVSTKLGQLASDIRSASDMAILQNKTYRLVLMLSSGDYWLEVTDRTDVYLGDAVTDHDPTEEEDKYAQELFDNEFKKYEYLAGEEVKDPDTGSAIKPTSPVLAAKKALSPIKWLRVQNLEWSKRTIGPYLFFIDVQAEHHQTKQQALSLGPDARAFIYFLPGGYVEPAVMHIAYKDRIDDQNSMHTVKTRPFEGMADVVAGYEEYNY